MPKTIPKSMKNQCKIHARKSDAKNMENHQKWMPKGSQKTLKIDKKTIRKKGWKKEEMPQVGPGAESLPEVPGGAQLS